VIWWTTPSVERSSPARLITLGQTRLKGGRVEQWLYSLEILTIWASRSGVWSHVTVTVIRIPVLYTNAMICTNIVTALCAGTWKNDSCWCSELVTLYYPWEWHCFYVPHIFTFIFSLELYRNKIHNNRLYLI